MPLNLQLSAVCPHSHGSAEIAKHSGGFPSRSSGLVEPTLVPIDSVTPHQPAVRVSTGSITAHTTPQHTLPPGHEVHLASCLALSGLHCKRRTFLQRLQTLVLQHGIHSHSLLGLYYVWAWENALDPEKMPAQMSSLSLLALLGRQAGEHT